MARVANDSTGGETISEILAKSDDGKRTFQWILWALVLATIGGVAFAFLRPWLAPTSLAVQAAKIAQLPADATVTQVKEGKWEGEGTIALSLPEPKGAGSRLDEIWTLNYLPLPAVHASSVTPFKGKRRSVILPSVVPNLKRTADSISWEEDRSPAEKAFTTVRYDSARKLYLYEHTVKREVGE